MKALFLTDSEMEVLLKILRAGIVQGSPMWMRKSIAGQEHNYTHGKIMELCRAAKKPDQVEEKRREMTIKRERRAALKLAQRAFDL